MFQQLNPGGLKQPTEQLSSGSSQIESPADCGNLPASSAFLLTEFHVNMTLDVFGARITGNMEFRPTGDKPKVFDP